MKLILLGTSIICAIGWILTRISLISIVWYLIENNYPFPNDEELKKGSEYAVKHFLKK